MTTGVLFLPFYAAIDGDGVPMAGAKLQFYTTGTTTPQDTYSQSDIIPGNVNTNPVVADADGLFPPIYLAPGPDYKAILKTAADVTIATRDPIAAPAAESSVSAGASAMQGRLSLVTATPVMVSAQTSKTVVYYTPYIGNTVPLWDGSAFVQTVFTELTNDLTASSVGKAGPAAAANNSNYDLFGWDDGGTSRLTRGPLWTSDTGRGTGAGTTQLTRVNGILTNTVAITNGPGAGFGTYLGSIRTDGSAQANWQPGGVDTPALLNVWNMYNRRRAAGLISDSTNSWNYTSGTVRAANNVNTVRASFIMGFQEEFFRAQYSQRAIGIGINGSRIGIGLDVTNAYSGRVGEIASDGSNIIPVHASLESQLLGFHFMQACESGDSATATTFYGDNGQTFPVSGLEYQGWF